MDDFGGCLERLGSSGGSLWLWRPEPELRQPFLSSADGWGGSAGRRRCPVGQHSVMREQGRMVPPDGSGEDKPTASSLTAGLQLPRGFASPSWGDQWADLSGKPHIHGIWNRRAEAPCRLMVSELCRERDESGGETGLLPSVAKPSTEPHVGRCHRSVRSRFTGGVRQ